ncbi:hypothetical protein LNP74_10460 [Klebsiella pneumoniae subsp. pneumoniae]|nr:hypothetical protein [Klebsiella pneumoniae subsp. pneumoniae]
MLQQPAAGRRSVPGAGRFRSLRSGARKRVDELYRDEEAWTRAAILNTGAAACSAPTARSGDYQQHYLAGANAKGRPVESKRLDNAALAAGISPSYINAHGKPQSIAAVTKQRLLDAMHRLYRRHESGG